MVLAGVCDGRCYGWYSFWFVLAGFSCVVFGAVCLVCALRWCFPGCCATVLAFLVGGARMAVFSCILVWLTGFWFWLRLAVFAVFACYCNFRLSWIGLV